MEHGFKNPFKNPMMQRAYDSVMSQYACTSGGLLQNSTVAHWFNLGYTGTEWRGTRDMLCYAFYRAGKDARKVADKQIAALTKGRPA